MFYNDKNTSLSQGGDNMTNDIDYIQLGKRIKQYRLSAKFTQESLAYQIDVATSTIAHAESGTNKPSLPLLIKISNALNITLDQLVFDSLSASDTYIEKDIADALSDCNTREKQIIRDAIIATKQILRKNRL